MKSPCCWKTDLFFSENVSQVLSSFHFVSSWKRLNMFATSAQNPEFLSYKDERRFRKLQTSTFRINLSKRKFASNFGYCRHESWKYFAKNFFLHNSSKLFLFRNIWRGGSTWLELGGVDWMIMVEPEFQEETSNRFPTQARLISTRLR